jgi:hypothetical protein
MTAGKARMMKERREKEKQDERECWVFPCPPAKKTLLAVNGFLLEVFVYCSADEWLADGKLQRTVLLSK